MLKKINISLVKQKFIVYVVLTFVTIAVFWQVNQFDFINVDDQTFVTENRYVPLGISLKGTLWAFSTTYAGFWHPLTWLSFMFDYQLFGLNAGGYHLTNLILHVLSTLLLFWLFNRMTGNIWNSAFVAAFFALHPHHVESVAWIAERKDVLSAFFWMLTLCLYVYYTEKPAVKRYLLVLCCFTCALMSKSMVVTLPVIMILLDYWPLRRFASKKGNIILWQLREKIPFIILSAVFSATTLSLWHNPSGKLLSLSSQLNNAPVAFVIYLGKIFWPHDMHLFHSFSDQLPLGQVLGATILILFISVIVIITVKRLPYLFVGWFWYAITLLPVLGIMHNGVYWMHEHYTYLPSIGIGTMLAWGIPILFPGSNIRKIILFPTGIFFLTIMAVISWQQCVYWKNSTTLFNHALQATKANVLAQNLLGMSLFDEGKNEEAFAQYNEAISTTPDYSPTYYNRGTAYGKTGQYQLAIHDFDQALKLNPDYIEAYNNRGIVYAELNQYQHAIEDYNQAIHLKPDYADAFNNRAIIYLYQGNNILGCNDARRACSMGVCVTLDAAKIKGYCR